jgi:hypothetical protein
VTWIVVEIETQWCMVVYGMVERRKTLCLSLKDDRTRMIPRIKDPDQRRSASGYSKFLCGAPATLKPKMQDLVTGDIIASDRSRAGHWKEAVCTRHAAHHARIGITPVEGQETNAIEIGQPKAQRF